MPTQPSPTLFCSIAGGVSAKTRRAKNPVAMPLRAITLGALIAGASAWAALSEGCAIGQPGEHSTPREYKVDKVTTAKVEGALDRDRSLKAFDFNVETVDGSVELNGYVDRLSQSTEANRDAARVSGVTSVQNDIVVRPDPPHQP